MLQPTWIIPLQKTVRSLDTRSALAKHLGVERKKMVASNPAVLLGDTSFLMAKRAAVSRWVGSSKSDFTA